MRRVSFRIFLTALLAFFTACSRQDLPETRSNREQHQMLKQLDSPVKYDAAELKQLEALGYLGGHETAAGSAGVLRHQPDKTAPSLNLVVSGHDPVIDLMTMDGTVIHSWHLPRNEVFPGDDDLPADDRSKSFRKAYALPDGDIVGIYNGTGMVRLDRNARLRWAQPAMCHHDLAFAPDGSIYTFIQRHRLYEKFNPTEQIFDEYIARLNPDTGDIIEEFSLIEAFDNSPFASWLKKVPPAGDIFHANTIVYIGDRESGLLPVYHSGDLLISLRNMDAILIVDASSRSVRWVLAGLWSFQHEPSILPDGNLLVFDNAGQGGRSKVIEVNPVTQEVIWSYADSPQTPLYSSTSGACHRLPNGNTLIVESNRGRAIEVMPDGHCVWEYINPHRWGANGALTATLFDVQRIPEEFFDDSFRNIPSIRNSGTSHNH